MRGGIDGTVSSRRRVTIVIVRMGAGAVLLRLFATLHILTVKLRFSHGA